MTTPINNAITNTVLPPQAQGQGVPDSIPTLAAVPQLIMPPGNARPVFKFEDGDGLTDAFGNIYVGYGDAGGSSEILVNERPQEQAETNAPADKNFWQFNAADNIWRLVDYETAQLLQVDTTTVAPADANEFVYNDAQSIVVPVSGKRAIGGTIEVPTNRVYTLFKDGLDFDITIISSSFTYETGPGSVTFPTGDITAGVPITITTTLTTGASTFLTFQIDYIRKLV